MLPASGLNLFLALTEAEGCWLGLGDRFQIRPARRLSERPSKTFSWLLGRQWTGNSGGAEIGRWTTFLLGVHVHFYWTCNRSSCRVPSTEACF